MKHVMTVKHADGTQETICPKCGQVMRFEDGGESCAFIRGEVHTFKHKDAIVCENPKCDLYLVAIDPDDTRKLELAFGAL